MYAGPGSGPLLAAAASWNGLAAQLETTAVSYQAAVANLTSEPWLGPASEAMSAAATPYVAWMHTTAQRAAQTAAQAHGAAAAYETAFAATVPPPVVAANRALLMQLLATNIFGQNAPAIAATQAEYAEMWAQDAAAMYNYSAAAAAATRLTALTSPEQVTHPDGAGDQAVAAGRAAADAAGTTTQHTLSGIPETLHQLALPLQALPAQVVDDPGLGAATATGVSGLSMGSAYHAAIGSANFFQRLASQFGFNQPETSGIKDTVDKIALATGAVESEEELQQPGGSPVKGFGSWQNWLNWLKGLGSHIFKSSATAGIGQATTVGSLSVPQNWAAAAPEVHLAVAESPDVSVDAAPAAGGGMGNLGAQAALAGMAGRALAGTVAPGGGAGTRSTRRERAKPSADAAREIAAALREYAALRDSGIITSTEFNKHKERLMSLDPLSGR